MISLMTAEAPHYQELMLRGASRGRLGLPLPRFRHVPVYFGRNQQRLGKFVVVVVKLWGSSLNDASSARANSLQRPEAEVKLTGQASLFSSAERVWSRWTLVAS